MRGTAAELAARYATTEPRGEVVLVSAGRRRGRGCRRGGGRRGAAAGRGGRARRGSAAGVVAELTGAPANALYKAVAERWSDSRASTRGPPRSAAACCVAVALRHRRAVPRSRAAASLRCASSSRARSPRSCNDSAPTQRRSAHIRPPPATRHLGSARARPPRPRSLFPSRLRSPQSWPRSWRSWRSPPPPWPSDGCGRSQARWRARSTTPAARRSRPARTAASTSLRRRARRSARRAPAASSTPAAVAGRGVVSVRCGARRVTHLPLRRSASAPARAVRARARSGRSRRPRRAAPRRPRRGRPVRLRRPDDAAARRGATASRRRPPRTPAPRPPAHRSALPPRRRSRDVARAGPAAPPRRSRRAARRCAPAGRPAPRPGRHGRAWRSSPAGAAGSGADRGPPPAGVPARSRRALRTSTPALSGRAAVMSSSTDRQFGDRGRRTPRSPSRHGVASLVDARRSPAPATARRRARDDARLEHDAGVDRATAPARRAANPRCAASLLASAHGLLRHDAHLLRERGAAPRATPTRRSGPTSSPATIASAGRTCSSSRAPTSTASRSRRSPSARAITPKELADRNAQRFLDLMPRINASNDFFIRTTDPRHKAKVQEVMQRVHDNGHVYKGLYEGWYCPKCADFKTEHGDRGGQHVPDPPHPARPRERGELVLPALDVRGAAQASSTRSSPDWVAPRTRYNEALAFINGGLQDVSLSRGEADLGRQVPWDPAHVFYVWFDALLNYYTALSLRPRRRGPDRHASGRRTSTSSARTSSSSTRSSGRRC